MDTLLPIAAIPYDGPRSSQKVLKAGGGDRGRDLRAYGGRALEPVVMWGMNRTPRVAHASRS